MALLSQTLFRWWFWTGKSWRRVGNFVFSSAQQSAQQ